MWMVALFVMICVSSQQAKSDIQGDFVRLPPDQRVWVEQSWIPASKAFRSLYCCVAAVNQAQPAARGGAGEGRLGAPLG
jgi:hypothetical protein